MEIYNIKIKLINNDIIEIYNIKIKKILLI